MRTPSPASAPRRASRLSFPLRLFASLLVTVVAIGLLQYALAARQLEQRVVAQAEVAHQGDARVLESLPHPKGAKEWAPVEQLLGHIAARPGVEQVSVVDPNGEVVAVGMKHATGTTGSKEMTGSMGTTKPMEMSGAMVPGRPVDVERRATVSGALVDGRTRSGDDPVRPGSSLYVVPIDFPSGRHALVVSKRDATLQGQLSDIRLILLLTLGAGALLAFPLFYFLGGRSLAARYAVERTRSSRDALTGLGNHRTFHEDLRRHVEIAQRRHGTVSLAMVDVDHFKQVNDLHGHGEGDRVLSRIATLLSSGRAGDVAYRVGGDEFALLLPSTTLEQAELVLERIRCRVTEEFDTVSVSIGIAEAGRPAADAETLLACADLALYKAKDTGRNRVVTSVATEPGRVPEPDPV